MLQTTACTTKTDKYKEKGTKIRRKSKKKGKKRRGEERRDNIIENRRDSKLIN